MNRQIKTIMLILTISCVTVSCAKIDEGIDGLAFYIKEKGNESSKQGEHERSIALYKFSLWMNPDYVANYYNIGSAYGRLGKKKEAFENFNLAIEHGYKKLRLYLNMAWFHKEWGEYDEAIEIYEVLATHQPDNLMIIFGLSRSYLETGRRDEAKVLVEHGLTLEPDNKHLLARMNYIKTDEIQNTPHADKANVLNNCQQKQETCEQAGHIALKSKQRETAQGYFEAACEQGAQTSCVQAGMIAYEDQDLVTAEVLFNSGCELKDKTSCTNLADFYWQRGDKKTAQTLYQQGCGFGSPRACGVLGDYLVKTHPDEAKKWYGLSCEMGNQEGCRRAARL